MYNERNYFYMIISPWFRFSFVHPYEYHRLTFDLSVINETANFPHNKLRNVTNMLQQQRAAHKIPEADLFYHFESDNIITYSRLFYQRLIKSAGWECKSNITLQCKLLFISKLYIQYNIWIISYLHQNHYPFLKDHDRREYKTICYFLTFELHFWI